MAAKKAKKGQKTKDGISKPNLKVIGAFGEVVKPDQATTENPLDQAVVDRKALLSRLGLPSECVIRKRFADDLRVKVSDADKAVLADQLANVIQERLALNDANAEKNRAYREKRAALDDQEKELAESVKSSSTLAVVDQVEILLPDNSVKIFRLDTDVLVGDSRAATAEELRESRQGALFEDDGDGDTIPPTPGDQPNMEDNPDDAPISTDTAELAAALDEGLGGSGDEDVVEG